ncbi:MAG: helix-turn-helix transcriptional regulator [Parcubacteria group bacterium]|nr:helix-turn-helix transcriptional regulator [Parcubacteria group bacterium]
MDLSKIIKEYRLKYEMTVDQLAISAKLSKGFLSRLENGDFDQKNISLVTMIKLARGLKIKLKDILDNLNIIEKNESPPLNIYLREKYKIKDKKDIETIERLVDRFKDS